ncbi:kinase-like domain-containing protein [Calycina marina]|uniref:Kinase-like domain-containing protein n=1 Tax=Calycina marina TaxID=1763456 RepID=A0A9P7Z5F1_9HELO|nr:kinase-like domain-containing protein [Calycina marina]
MDVASTNKNSLESTPYACSALDLLSGGVANYVFRGKLRVPFEGVETVVVKHTPGYVASSPGFKLTATRCVDDLKHFCESAKRQGGSNCSVDLVVNIDEILAVGADSRTMKEYEVAMLSALQDFPPSIVSGITIQTPILHRFLSSLNTQIYSDLPNSISLKNYALTQSLDKEQSLLLGRSLGLWTTTFTNGQTHPHKRHCAMKDLKFRINYGTLMSTIDKFPAILEESREIFQMVCDEARTRHDSVNGELVHADFWSGNIVIPDEKFKQPMQVYVVDWELSKLGAFYWDLGQMFAELYNMKHFKNIEAGFWLIQGFMDGYGSITKSLVRRPSRSPYIPGNHLICWGTRVEGWGTEAQVEDLAQVGRDFIVNGRKEDKQYFLGTALACLLK